MVLDKPKISIIVPIFNVEFYLERCINSILNQQFIDFELILVNDGSIDNSLKVCRKYEKIDRRIRVIDKENGGVSSARNLGIKLARGEFISFIDADDKILPNYFTTFYNMARKENCDVIVAGYKLSNCDKEIIPNFKKNTVLSGSDFILTNNKVHTCNDLCFPWRYFYRLNIINKNNIRFDENISIGEDTVFNMEVILKSNRVMGIDQVVYQYTIDNPDSAMRAKYKPKLESSLVLQYEKRYQLSKEFNLINNSDYSSDMANYYIKNILNMIINNIKSSSSENKHKDIRRIINHDMFRRSFRKIGLRCKGYSSKEQILYIFMKFRVYPAINYILNIK